MIALTKVAAAVWTGSSAMLSEGVHSVVDTSNQLLLLYGINRAQKPPDEDHPLGYGRELYFWSFIVALLIFSLGAGVSFYQGIAHIRVPVHIADPIVNYVVLAISFIFEGATFLIALKEFNKTRGTLGYIEAVHLSKDPPSFLVLFEDSAQLPEMALQFFVTLAPEGRRCPGLKDLAGTGTGISSPPPTTYPSTETTGRW